MQGAGYFVSSLSVVLLGIVAWQSASEHMSTLACLIAGMITSMCGMALRWLAHRKVRAEQEQLKAEVKPAHR